MYEKIKTYIRRYSMIEKEDVVIAGVSGGADSVCLLLLLEKLKKEWNFGLAVVHVNHCLRGKDADADEIFVRNLCEKMDIPILCVREDVKAYAEQYKLSEEEAGREVRRAAYRQAMDAYNGTKIALAHHMDDNAETMLLNLARGTGMKGMAGIRPVNSNYIRPLLAVRRSEIEEYLRKQHTGYQTDSTNLEDAYTRNRIRNHVIPYLESHVNRKTVEHMQEYAEQMEQAAGYLDRQTDKLWNACVKDSDIGYQIALKPFREEDKALHPYLIRRVIAAAAGREKDIESVHVRNVAELCDRQSGRRVMLPYGLEAVREYDTIWIRKKKSEMERWGNGKNGVKECEGKLSEVLLCRPGKEVFDRQTEEGVHLRVFTCEKIPDAFEERLYTKWFDYDIIQNDVVLRGRRSGDYLQIDAQGHTQKLKNYLINAKIPKGQRDQIPLIAAGQEILWIIGYRQNQKYQVTEHTKRILEIQVEDYGGKEDGRAY